MQLAIHYSAAAAALLRQGPDHRRPFQVPGLVRPRPAGPGLRPAYVHVVLAAGRGLGEPTDGDGRPVADWPAIDALLEQTATPYVNVHLAARVRDYPDLDGDDERPATVERVAEALVRDLRPLVARYGPAQVIVENGPYHAGVTLRAACRPSVIRAVIEEVGCGLLLDLAHARIAASALGEEEPCRSSASPSPSCRRVGCC
jgi:uncharacterized protein